MGLGTVDHVANIGRRDCPCLSLISDAMIRRTLVQAEHTSVEMFDKLERFVMDSRLMRVALIRELRDALEQRESLRVQRPSATKLSAESLAGPLRQTSIGIEQRIDEASRLRYELEDTMARLGSDAHVELAEAAEENEGLVQLLADAERERAAIASAVTLLDDNAGGAEGQVAEVEDSEEWGAIEEWASQQWKQWQLVAYLNQLCLQRHWGERHQLMLNQAVLWWSKHEAVFALARWRVVCMLTNSETRGDRYREKQLLQEAMSKWLVVMAENMSDEAALVRAMTFEVARGLAWGWKVLHAAIAVDALDAVLQVRGSADWSERMARRTLKRW